jgi:WD40 repeat protein
MGLARLTHADDQASSTMTHEGTVMGTPDYIAPEQAVESHTVDIRADLYSLGCTFYYLLTGRVPFPGGTFVQKINKHQFDQPPPVEQLRPEVPPAVASIVRRLMAKRPDDRYQTPAEVAAALGVLGGEQDDTPHGRPPLAPHPSPLAPHPSDWSSVVAAPSHTEVLPSPRRQRQTKAEWRWRLWVAAGGAVLIASVVLLVTLLAKQQPQQSAGKPKEEPPSTEDHAREALHELFVRSGDRNTDREALRRDVLEFLRTNPGTPQVLPAAEILRALPAPLDKWPRSTIPSYELAAAGGGDPRKAPPELVAVLGDSRLKHWNQVTTLAFTADGKQLASASADGTAILWDVASGSQQQVLPAGSISGDGQALLSANPDGTGILWDLRTGRRLQALKVAGLLSPDHNTVVAQDSDGSMVFWSTARDRQLRKLNVGPGNFQTFSLDSHTFAQAAGRTVTLWNVASGEQRRAITSPNNIASLALSQDGRTLAIGGKSATLWDAETGKQRGTITDEFTGPVALSPDGKTLAAAWAHFVKLFDVQSLKRIEQLPVLSTGFIGPLVFSSDGKMLAAGDHTGTIVVWDLATKQGRGGLQAGDSSYRSVAISPDGQTIAAGSWSGPITVWDAGTGKVLHTLLGHRANVPFLVFSPDGKLLLSAANHPDNTIKIWNLATGKLDRTLVPNSVPYSLQISPEGKTVACHCWEAGFLHFWDLSADAQHQARSSRDGYVTIDPSWKVYAVQQNGFATINLRRVASGDLIGTLDGNASGGRSLVFSPDGKLLAAPQAGIRLWDVAARGIFRTLGTLSTPPVRVAFNPDGKSLASVSFSDGKLRFWDPSVGPGASGSRGSLQVGPAGGGIHEVVYSSDGRHLLTVNGNKTIYILRPPDP